MKRILSVVLALAMFLSMAPVATFDVQATSVSTNGNCGENLTWTLDNDGLLTISGIGAMESYGMWETPWADSVTLIKKVVVEDGVDGIGSCAFLGCSNMTEVSLPSGLRYIDWSAFEGCESLSDVTIPDSVTAIGMYAFSGCTDLTEIAIPDSVTGIYTYAFQRCNSLKSVTIGSGVSFIGEGVFSYCEALESIRFKGNAPTFDSGYNESPTCFCGVTATVYYPQENATWTKDVRQDYLGDITWVGYSNYVASGACGTNLTWKLDDDGVLTISGTGSMKNYTNYADPWRDYLTQITSVVMEDGVTSIGDYAFRSCSNLTSVSIPDSVTSIGYYAFQGCSSLSSIAIPDGVNSLGNSAFRGCSSLTSIAIPDGIERIGTYMFYNCSGLTSVVIPESIIGIVEYAFYNCSSLCHVLYKGTEEQWNAIGTGLHNDSLTDATRHYNCAGDEIVGDKCSICNLSIDLVAGGNCGDNLTWTLDKDGLLTISGTGAMYNYCTVNTIYGGPVSISIGFGPWKQYNVENVIIESGVTQIGSGAFWECYRLKSITIPDSVIKIGDCAFYDCVNLTSITLPDSVTHIGYYAFREASGLTSITIPAGVTQIKATAFLDATNLAEIKFLGDAPTIGYDAFENVTATAYYPGNNDTWTTSMLQDYKGTITWEPYISGTCGENVSWAFDADSGTITISGTGDMYDFAYSTMPWNDLCDNILTVVIEDGVTSVGDWSFSYCDALTSTVIADSVVRIGEYAFAECQNMTALDLGDGITEICQYAFNYCKKLTSVVIPDGVTVLNQNAFGNCHVLSSVTLPEGLTTIGPWAFSDCALVSISIPKSVTAIERAAFSFCGKLQDVYYGGNRKMWHEIAIVESGNEYLRGATMHYTDLCQAGHIWLDATCESPKTCSVCGATDGEALGHSYENYFCTICGELNAFVIDYGVCGDNLTWMLGADGLLTISGTGAMHDYEWENPAPWHVYNEQIYTVVIEEGVTNIGALAFSDCINMTSIVIPDSVTSIGYAAFNACSSLTNITIPDAVTSMEDAAFYGCSNLQSIELPAGLTNIAWSLFDGCSSLESIVIPDGVTSIGGYAFSVCNSLTSIVIPDSVTNIDRDAFNACDNLWHVLYKGTEEQWNAMFVDENPCLTNVIRHYNCTGMEILDEEKQICILCDSNIRQIVTVRGEEITVSVILDQAYTVRAGGASVTYDASVLEYVSGQWHVTGTLLANVDDAMHTGAFAYTSATQIEGTIFTYTFKVLDSAALETSWLTCSIVLKDGSDLPLEVPALEYAITVTEHIYESVVTAPTCTEGGFTTHTCTLCGESYTDSYTDPLGHSEVVQPAVAPTCTLTGLTEGKYCATCGEVFAQQQAVPALGHSYRYRVDTAPTDAAEGILMGICSVCGSSETVDLPMLNTTDYTYSVEVEATYTTTGIGRYSWNNDAYGSFYFDVVLEKLIMPSDSVVTVGSATGKSGETVEVILTLADAPNIRAMGLSNFVYDRDNLTLISGEWLLEGAILASWDENMQTAAIAYMNDTDLNGAIFKLTFQIHEDAPEGTYTVSCDATAKIKPDGEDITIAVASEAGDITVKNYVPGDVDGDETIDTDDAIYLLYYTLFGDSMYPLNQLGDFDGDGTVDTDDAIYLLYYTLFGDSMYPLH